MQKILEKQYNPVVVKYTEQINSMNAKSSAEFKKVLKNIKPQGNRLIELGCGAGDLIPYLQGLSYICSGVDTSAEMVACARDIDKANILVEDFAHTSFKDESFDIVVSKWAIQTAYDIDAVYRECYRLLKKDGILVFLVVHPFRQFLEKKKKGKDYFTQEIVESRIFNGTITVKEPSHTMTDYLSDYFLENFLVTQISESFEFPGAEQINNDTYPTHLLVTAQKR